ncbi:hypothetical protein GCM10009834_27320 [Streptomonospora arabica]
MTCVFAEPTGLFHSLCEKPTKASLFRKVKPLAGWSSRWGTPGRLAAALGACVTCGVLSAPSPAMDHGHGP